MPDSKARAFVHFVWATKGRLPRVTAERERALFRVIEESATERGCRVIALNGMPDHVHLLVQFGRTVSMAQLMKQVKGASSRFMNQSNLSEGRPDDFRWQVGYGAFTLGRDQVDAATWYIRNQKRHHAAGDLWPSWEDAEEDAPVPI